MNARTWDRRGLRTRAVSLVAFGMLLSTGLMGWAAWRGLEDLSSELLEERRLLAQSLATHADDIFRQSLEGLYGLTSVGTATPPDTDYAAERAVLRASFLRSRLLAQVVLLKPGGEPIWEEPPNGSAVPAALAAAAQEATRSGKPAFSSLVEVAGCKRLFVAVPLRDVHGTSAGVAAVALDPGSSTLAALLRPYALKPGGAADLVDARGTVVASSEPARVSASAWASAPIEPLREKRPFVARAHGEVLAASPLSFVPLFVVLRQPQAGALAPVAAFRRKLVWLSPFVVAVALLFGWGAARSLTQPLGLLTEAAERIAGGEIARPIPRLPDDEVGRLGRSLEAMRANLSASLDGIRRANEQLEWRVAERTAELERLYHDLQDREERRAKLLRKLITAQEDERKRIARDLHDQTCQTVAALAVGLETALTSPTPDEARAKLSEVKGLAARTLDDLHELIFALRPSVLDDLGLASAVRWYAARNVEPRGIAVRCEVEGLEERLPPEIETAVFRAVQEALTNVVRHAGAEAVLLQLSLRDQLLTVEVEDDGRGFDVGSVAKPAASGRGLGLLGIRERVEIIGGRLTVDSSPGQGTRLVFEVPVPAGATGAAGGAGA